MNNALIILLALIAWSCESSEKPIATSSITPSPEETGIAKSLIQGAFDDLWGGVDSSKISQYHTDDFIILENGEVWDNDRIKVYMRGQLANANRAKRVNKMDYISIEKYGPSLQIAYDNYAEFYQGDSLVGKAHWLESATAIETPSGWRLRMMHSTYVPQKK